MEKPMEQEKPAQEPHPIDAMTAAELFSEMIAFFGPSKVLELCGWVTLAGLISEVLVEGNPALLRKEMEKRGFTKSSLYRALADLRRFGEHIEGRAYPAQDHRETLRFISRLSKLQARGSQFGELAV